MQEKKKKKKKKKKKSGPLQIRDVWLFPENLSEESGSDKSV